MLMLVVFVLGILFEILLYSGFFWRWKKILAFVISILVLIPSLVWAITSASFLTFLLFSVTIYRVVNLFRLIEDRLHKQYLKKAFVRASLIFIALQSLLLIVQELQIAQTLFIGVSSSVLMIASTGLLAAITIFLVAISNIRSTRFRPAQKFYSDNELPTVSVAIPARNETAHLTECIDTILSSDYPKLEVLVLDDCSQDKTSDVIRAYAQSGVRFLHGREPNTNWLAKNQAYAQLAEAANGEFIVFCGVDTRIGVHTLRSLVTMAQEREKDMVSVLPRLSRLPITSSIIQPLRYWWELALPRKLFNRPPVLSTFWMVRRKQLLKYGGFRAVSRSVLPEAYFAKRFIPHNGYSFVRTSNDIKVHSEKEFGDQLERALRVRYPEVHRRLELVWLLTVMEICLLVGPFVLFSLAVIQAVIFLLITTLLTSVLLLAASGMISAVSTEKFSFVSVILFPLSVLVEIVVANLSMLRYEFSEVTWKERNICIPIMDVKRVTQAERADRRVLSLE